MSAKEMFEKSGYNFEIRNNDLIQYSEKKYYENKISFYKDIIIIFRRYKTKKDKFILVPTVITLKELQAINKQVEELGW